MLNGIPSDNDDSNGIWVISLQLLLTEIQGDMGGIDTESQTRDDSFSHLFGP
jgi:hypothetical protein